MDFALILFLLSVVTGALWFFDVFKARKLRSKGSPDPWWVEYGASFFPVILPIFLLRSFWVEPFRIPSGSMVPTLMVGDFILVNKYTYGVRLPVLNKKIIEVNLPQRGDVMVFRYPQDKTQDYIKRVVGLPGDKIEYINKRLTVNGVAVPVKDAGDFVEGTVTNQRFLETLGDVEHAMLNNPADNRNAMSIPHPYNENCVRSAQNVICTVPPGHYFMMGDNRDNSADSRVWGFVPEENIVGKAFFVWFHIDSILPFPKGIDFSRIGSFK
ncbi:signal peptidase I [Viridibacterium curvum]|uniref:signal peptidase I n=1 Tax=Viridibacterium curvum TaxID=1101404 RepID=UPI0031EB717E